MSFLGNWNYYYYVKPHLLQVICTIDKTAAEEGMMPLYKIYHLVVRYLCKHRQVFCKDLVFTTAHVKNTHLGRALKTDVILNPRHLKHLILCQVVRGQRSDGAVCRQRA